MAETSKVADVAGFARRVPQRGTLIEITAEDARRCNRLRGKSIRDCVCRVGDCWQKCPAGAHLGILDPDVIRDCLLLAQTEPLVAVPNKKRNNGLSGDCCQDCGSFAMVRTGTCLTCQVCGSSSGGCS